jgi:hypothetical protein
MSETCAAARLPAVAHTRLAVVELRKSRLESMVFSKSSSRPAYQSRRDITTFLLGDLQAANPDAQATPDGRKV